MVPSVTWNNLYKRLRVAHGKARRVRCTLVAFASCLHADQAFGAGGKGWIHNVGYANPLGRVAVGRFARLYLQIGQLCITTYYVKLLAIYPFLPAPFSRASALQVFNAFAGFTFRACGWMMIAHLCAHILFLAGKLGLPGLPLIASP